MLVLCVALALTACGGGTPTASGPSASGPPNNGSVTPTSTGTSGGTTRGSSSATTGSVRGSPTPSVSAAPTDQFPESVPGTPEAPLEVQLQFGCLRPGGAQRITIRSTPGLQFAWGTTYSDGTNHDEWGGQDVGYIPPGGVFTKTWPIPVGAPLGEVRNDVAVTGKVNGENAVGMKHPTWQIARSC